jgi:hypothetical protein
MKLEDIHIGDEVIICVHYGKYFNKVATIVDIDYNWTITGHCVKLLVRGRIRPTYWEPESLAPYIVEPTRPVSSLRRVTL